MTSPGKPFASIALIGRYASPGIADPLARLPTARTQPFSFREIVFYNLAGEGIGEPATTTAPANVLADDQRCGVFGKWIGG